MELLSHPHEPFSNFFGEGITGAVMYLSTGHPQVRHSRVL